MTLIDNEAICPLLSKSEWSAVSKLTWMISCEYTNLDGGWGYLATVVKVECGQLWVSTGVCVEDRSTIAERLQKNRYGM